MDYKPVQAFKLGSILAKTLLFSLFIGLQYIIVKSVIKHFTIHFITFNEQNIELHLTKKTGLQKPYILKSAQFVLTLFYGFDYRH